jgi:hypothetical protein
MMYFRKCLLIKATFCRKVLVVCFFFHEINYILYSLVIFFYLLNFIEFKEIETF